MRADEEDPDTSTSAVRVILVPALGISSMPSLSSDSSSSRISSPYGYASDVSQGSHSDPFWLS
jgi:hypothetical protein